MHVNLEWRQERSQLGREISYELRPLRVWAFQELMAFWEEHARTAEEGGQARRLSAADGMKLMTVARRIFPDHVRNLQGVTLADGGASTPAPIEALCEEAPLLPLAGEIVARLVAISEVGAGEEKN